MRTSSSLSGAHRHPSSLERAHNGHRVESDLLSDSRKREPGFVGIDLGDGPECQVHATIKACQDYMSLIDEDWLKIADWYRPGSKPIRSVQAADLYEKHVAATQTIHRRTTAVTET